MSRGQRRQPSGISDRRLTSQWTQGDKNLSWSLNLTNKGLSTIPEYVFQRTNLRDLQLTNNKITELPRDIMRLEYLLALKLDDNELAGLPPVLAYLNCLKILHVSYNKILQLDDGLALPPNLVEARFSNNRIRVLPKNLFMSSKFLQILDFTSNHLFKLPACQWSNDLPNLE